VSPETFDCPELRLALESEGRESSYGNAEVEIYDTAIPNECFPCVRTALSSLAAYTQKVRDATPAEGYCAVDKWTAIGVLSSVDGELFAVEEYGVGDVDGEDLLSAVFARLRCVKRQDDSQ
jgi:hypothetical protein